MGNTWEVLTWEKVGSGGIDYCWVEKYSGESFVIAILTAISARRKSGCVKIEWR